MVHRESRQFEKSWNALERCQKIWEGCDPPNYTWIATCVNDRAILLTDEGKPEDYLAIYQEAHSIFEKSEKDGHPEMAITIQNVAPQLESNGNSEEAIAYYRHGLAMAESFMMPHNHRCQSARENLAMALIRSAKYQEALSLMRDSMRQHEISPGPDHDDTVRARVSFCNAAAYALWLDKEVSRPSIRQEIRAMCRTVSAAPPLACLGFLILSSNLHRIREFELSEFALETAKRASLGNANRDWKEAAERQSSRLFADIMTSVVSNAPMSEIARSCQQAWEAAAPIIKEHADCLAQARRQVVRLITWTGNKRIQRERDVDSVREAFDLVSQLGSDSPETLDQLSILTVILHNERFYEISEKLC
jgi:tetratricopeptide (TPR) repeat protein